MKKVKIIKIIGILMSFSILNYSSLTSFATDSINTELYEAENSILRTDLTENEVSEAYSMATEILTEYYRSIVNVQEDTKSVDKSIAFNDKIKELVSTPELGKYISDKQAYRKYVESSVGIVYASHSGEYTLEDYKIQDGAMYLLVSADIIEPYQNGEISGYGELVEFLFVKDNDQIKIADWYSTNIYDWETRGYDQSINDPDFWSKADNAKYVFEKSETLLSNTKSIQNALKDNKNFIDIPENAVELQNVGLTRAVTAFSTTARSNMVSYANTNCSLTNPSSGGFSVPYFDFSTISGNYDCTNFVSHVLLKGGAKPYNTSNGVNGIYSTGWFYENMNRRSSSWSGVSSLHSFLVSNAAYGPRGTSSVTYGIPQFSPFTFDINQMKGNIIQIDYSSYSSSYDHCTVLSGSYSSLGSGTLVNITSRTAPKNYILDKPLASSYPSATAVRVIYLTGYSN